jgi:hypothetical protein
MSSSSSKVNIHFRAGYDVTAPKLSIRLCGTVAEFNTPISGFDNCEEGSRLKSLNIVESKTPQSLLVVKKSSTHAAA